MLAPRRRVVERGLARAAPSRRLPRDYEWPPEAVAGFDFPGFATLKLKRLVEGLAHSS